MYFRLSVLQNHKSPILNQLVFGYAFAIRLGDDAVEEIALQRIKNEAPAIKDLECAVEIASDAGFAEETFKLVSPHVPESQRASADGFPLRSITSFTLITRLRYFDER